MMLSVIIIERIVNETMIIYTHMNITKRSKVTIRN